MCVCVSIYFYPCSSSPCMFPNLLHKVLLMPAFLEVDTVGALFPHSPPPAPGSGPQLRVPSGTVAAKVGLGLPGEQSAATDSQHHSPGAYSVPGHRGTYPGL